MSKRRWTDAQQKVIDDRGRNLLVSAAAGSGKTAVLIERIMKKISEGDKPADVDRLLVVTFTNAAAAEMKERLLKAVDTVLTDDPENEHMRRQRLLLNNANIMTIDSFCLKVLRNYYQTADIDPAFRIADESELALTRSDVMDELMEECYAEMDEGFKRLVDCYGTAKSDSEVREAIEKVYKCSQSAPWPGLWLEQSAKYYDVTNSSELSESAWMIELVAACRETLKCARDITDKNLMLARMEDGPECYIDALLSDSDIIGLAIAAKNYEELQVRLSEVSFARLSTKRSASAAETDIRDEIKANREVVKKLIGELCVKYFASTPEEIIAEIEYVRVPVRKLLELTKSFADRYSRAKRRMGVCDFSDIEHYALQILRNGAGDEAVPSEAALEMASQFDEIMIDEYQDSNFVQEYILTAISGDNKAPYMFTVGDVKQSIYKFRMARPELFNMRYHRFLEGEGGAVIDLDRNFRSRPVVLDAVNSVFCRIMHDTIGGVEYDERASLKNGRDFPESACAFPELRIIDLDDMPDDTDVNKIRVEAMAAAVRIKELVDSDEFRLVDDNTGEFRKCQYGDIAILLRTMSGWSNEFAMVLQDAGIPVISDIQSGFFETMEIQTVINMLRILDNPLQDVPLTAVLYSAVGRLSCDELALVRAQDGISMSMYKAARRYLEGGKNDSVAQKLAEFFEIYDELRCSSTLEITVLLRKIYEKTGIRDYCLALPSGERRAANLDMLMAKAAAFEATAYHGLFNFVRYLERMQKLEIDYGEALPAGEISAVRIMSIHKSKGLEFPVVILAGMGKNFNKQDSRGKFTVHSDFGVAVDLIDPVMRTKASTVMKSAFSALINRDSCGEELRVLYVALTRAKEKLIVTAACNNTADLDEIESSYSQILSAPSFIEVIYPAMKAENYVISVSSSAEIVAGAEELFAKAESIGAGDRAFLEGGEICEELKAQREFRYCNEEELMVPTKVSVSELKKRAYLEENKDEDEIPSFFAEDEDLFKTPEFLGGVTGASKGALLGTLYHLVLQLFPFDKEECNICDYLSSLAERQIIANDEKDSISVKKLEAFLKTSLASRMKAAERQGKLYREKQFMYSISADRVDPLYDKERKVIVQGIIDAYFEEDGELVIMDYKTDFVKSGEELTDRYRAQLDYYSEALEKLTGMRVKERILYSFCLGEEIRL